MWERNLFIFASGIIEPISFCNFVFIFLHTVPQKLGIEMWTKLQASQQVSSKQRQLATAKHQNILFPFLKEDTANVIIPIFEPWTFLESWFCLCSIRIGSGEILPAAMHKNTTLPHVLGSYLECRRHLVLSFPSMHSFRVFVSSARTRTHDLSVRVQPSSDWVMSLGGTWTAWRIFAVLF